MNNNEPITQGLRRTVDSVFSLCGMDEVTHKALLNHCDNIDAIHEKLRKTLKARQTANNTEVWALVNRLLDAAEKRENITLWGTNYTALPLDADGVPINIGDNIKDISDPHNYGTVYNMAIRRDGWWIYFTNIGVRPTECRHYHEPTVMDVLDNLLMN